MDAGRHLDYPSAYGSGVQLVNVIPGLLQGGAGLVQFGIRRPGNLLDVNTGRTGDSKG